MIELGTLGELAKVARASAGKLFGDRRGQVDEAAVIEAAEELAGSLSKDQAPGGLAPFPLVQGMLMGYILEWSLLVEAASSADGDLVVLYAPGEELSTDGLVPPMYPAGQKPG